MKVIVVGAGLGGLACGLSCRKQGIEVIILERAPELAEVGAGIQVPPNACRALDYIGVLDAVKAKATEMLARNLRRWDNGRILATREYGVKSYDKYGYPALTIHRADLQNVLLSAARTAGVHIRLGCEVESVDYAETTVRLVGDGETVRGDIIVAADGLWSRLRGTVVPEGVEPTETGDLAYRGTFSREQLHELGDEQVKAICGRTQELNLWLGPLKHAVFYPIRGGAWYNLVLLKPDDMEHGSRTEEGGLQEVLQAFEGWDPVLTKICSCFSSVLKWKLCHHSELITWIRGNVVLLGDSAHPTLPYQSQGAAMAFGDAAVLGSLLGQYLQASPKPALASVLRIYESTQKPYSTFSVNGARINRDMYHLPDGEEQQRRDEEFATMSEASTSKWIWIDGAYQRRLIATDLVKEAAEAFERLLAEKSAQCEGVGFFEVNFRARMAR